MGGEDAELRSAPAGGLRLDREAVAEPGKIVFTATLVASVAVPWNFILLWI
jgi:hypothetical protein